MIFSLDHEKIERYKNLVSRIKEIESGIQLSLEESIKISEGKPNNGHKKGRANYDYSWHKEKIDYDEYYKRLMGSTCIFE